MNWFPNFNYILASKSPRRQQLLSSLGIQFQVRLKEVEEHFPDNLAKEEIPVFLAELKAAPFVNELTSVDLLLTADTIVWLNDEVFGKPINDEEAKLMLQKLSGKWHQVITGVTLTSKNKQSSFYSTTDVLFKKLTQQEIDYYILKYKPFDKAGAYGIQEWIGTIGISEIKGSFYNVMGLPIQKLYEKIQKF